jgi:hypothetical protein
MVVTMLHKDPMMLTSSVVQRSFNGCYYVVLGPMMVVITLYKDPMMGASSVVQRSFDGCYYVA